MEEKKLNVFIIVMNTSVCINLQEVLLIMQEPVAWRCVEVTLSKAKTLSLLIAFIFDTRYFDRTLRNVKVKGCKSQKDRAEENLHNTFEKGDKISMIIILAYCVRRQCNITPRT